MGQEITTQPSTPAFVLPNRDALAKKSGNIFKLLVIGTVGIAAYFYLLPFLIGIVWGTTELIIGGIITFILLAVVTNKKFWRGMNLMTQWIAKKFLGFWIEMDRWQVMYNVVDAKAKDLETVRIQNVNIRGQQAQRKKELDENNDTMRTSKEKIDLLQDRLRNCKSQAEKDETVLQLSDATSDFNNAMGFINDVKPLYNDLTELVNSTDKIYHQGTVMLKIARKSIDNLKKRFEAVSSGSKAVQSGQAALSGRADLQADAALAMESVQKEIGLKLGMITQGIQSTSEIMNANDLNDAAKVRMAVNTIKQLGIDDKFNYSDTITSGELNLTDDQKSASQGNKYLDILK